MPPALLLAASCFHRVPSLPSFFILTAQTPIQCCGFLLHRNIEASVLADVLLLRLQSLEMSCSCTPDIQIDTRSH